MDAQALVDQIMEAMRGYIARANASRDTRLCAVEMRVGALSMVLGKGPAGQKISDLEALLQRVTRLEELEARVKALEDRP